MLTSTVAKLCAFNKSWYLVPSLTFENIAALNITSCGIRRELSCRALLHSGPISCFLVLLFSDWGFFCVFPQSLPLPRRSTLLVGGRLFQLRGPPAASGPSSLTPPLVGQLARIEHYSCTPAKAIVNGQKPTEAGGGGVWEKWQE